MKEEIDYNWSDTSNMLMYELDVFDRYLRTKSVFGFMGGLMGMSSMDK